MTTKQPTIFQTYSDLLAKEKNLLKHLGLCAIALIIDTLSRKDNHHVIDRVAIRKIQHALWKHRLTFNEWQCAANAA